MGAKIKLRVSKTGDYVPICGAAESLIIDAVSPVVTFEPVEGGTKMIVTDVDGVKETIIYDGKAELEFDDTPTQGSTNPVTSGGIYSALDWQKQDLQYFINSNTKAINNLEMITTFKLNQKQDTLTFDNAPAEFSTNPVTSKGIKAAIDTAVIGVTGKADKVSNAAAGDFAALDANGNLTDSGKKPSDFVTGQTLTDALSGKQDTLTFDTAPAFHSSNPVTSEGIYTSINSLKVDLESGDSFLQTQISSNTSRIIDLNVNKQNRFQVTNVSGTDPTIQADSDHRYVCDTVNTLTIYPDGLSITDVLFKSGTTPTVLNVVGPIKWPSWFDPTALEASVTYDIRIINGEYATVDKWT